MSVDKPTDKQIEASSDQSPFDGTPKVIVTRRLPGDIEQRLSDLFDATLSPNNQAMSTDELKAAVQNCDVLVPTVTDHISAEVLAAAGPRLKMIANFGAGTDHIDVRAAHDRGIIVTNTPGVLTEDTADLTLALILAVPRRLVEGDRITRAGRFYGWIPTGLLGHRVRGKRLGIIGMGRIGQAVARRAKAFGLEVHYHNRRPVSAPIEESLAASYWSDLDAMLPHIDILSINCPLTPATTHLMNAARLSLMSPDSYIVNTARGGIIDEAALAAALEAGEIGGAGLDVYEEEPSVHTKLLDLPNVVLAPHIGSATHESRQEMGEKVLINIHAFTDHHRCPDRVLPPRTPLTHAS